MRRMEAAGRPRAEISHVTGRTLGHVRQVIWQARRDGLLPARDETQMDLALTAAGDSERFEFELEGAA